MTPLKLGQILAILGDAKWKGCLDVMVEALDHLWLLPTSIVDIYKSVQAPFSEVQRHISAPLHYYTGKAGSDFGGSWWLLSGNDLGAMGLIVLQAISILFVLFFLLYHDCTLVGGCVWCGVFWSSASWAACCRSAQHPSHVSGMNPQWTWANHTCYHPSKLYLASAYSPFYENIAMLIILDHLIDYGLSQNSGPTSLGPGGLFVEP